MRYSEAWSMYRHWPVPSPASIHEASLLSEGLVLLLRPASTCASEVRSSGNACMRALTCAQGSGSSSRCKCDGMAHGRHGPAVAVSNCMALDQELSATRIPAGANSFESQAAPEGRHLQPRHRLKLPAHFSDAAWPEHPVSWAQPLSLCKVPGSYFECYARGHISMCTCKH